MEWNNQIKREGDKKESRRERGRERDRQTDRERETETGREREREGRLSVNSCHYKTGKKEMERGKRGRESDTPSDSRNHRRLITSWRFQGSSPGAHHNGSGFESH